VAIFAIVGILSANDPPNRYVLRFARDSIAITVGRYHRLTVRMRRAVNTLNANVVFDRFSSRTYADDAELL